MIDAGRGPRVPLVTLMTAACIAAVCSSLLAQPDTGRTRIFKYLMGTSVRVEVYGGTPASRQQAVDEALSAIAEVDRIMSDYRDDSELARMNRTAAANAVMVSDPMFAVLSAADRVARESNGAFDITMRPLSVLWGLKSSSMRTPTSAELSAIRPVINSRNVQLDPPAHTVRFIQRGMAIDLGGVAKGFAAEIAAGSITRRGLSGVVDISGHQFMVGRPLGKTSWTVGITDPFRPGRLLGAVDLERGGVSTTAAGADDRATGHSRRVLDPHTLEPATRCVSATVISTDGTLAQALSNAACVLGADAGLALLDHFPDTWGVIAVPQRGGSLGTTVSSGHSHAFHPASDR